MVGEAGGHTAIRGVRIRNEIGNALFTLLRTLNDDGFEVYWSGDVCGGDGFVDGGNVLEVIEYK